MSDIKRLYEPRDYQLEIFDAALRDNVIACMGTGTGKTFISIMLIGEFAHELGKPFSDEGKRTIFLVPTIPLVHQQKKVIEDHTELVVDGFYREMGADTWTVDRWKEEFSRNQVLVMVADIFRRVLCQGLISLSRINLIIFDECHRAVKNHPYREIARLFLSFPEPHPRILGLTASVINGKCSSSRLEREILNLEQTLRSKALVASDVTSVGKFGTKPKEMMYYFTPPGEMETIEPTKSIVALLFQAQGLLDVAKRKADQVLELDESAWFLESKNCISDIANTLKNMGGWCAHHLLSLYSGEIEISAGKSSKTADVKQTWAEIHSALQSARALMEPGLDLLDVPHKLERLLRLLQCHATDENNFSCIIFVQRRITAYILNTWLREVSRLEQYAYLKCEYIVGQGNPQGLEKRTQSTTEAFVDKQRIIMNKFRSQEINLLVASSVIEEGIDIPQCRLVVRYDPPLDYRSFVQSKGRARAKNSLFVIMVPNDKKEEINFIKDIVNYKTIDSILLKMCRDREVPDKFASVKQLTADTEEDPYKPFPSGAPIIPLTSAISIVHHYCSLLPSDRYTRSNPMARFVEVPVEGHSTPGYACQMKMPLNSVVKDWVSGRAMSTKTAAKMSAALAVCKLLHEAGELDDEHLLPISSKRSKGKEGDHAKGACYPKKIADQLYGRPPEVGKPCYVYSIVMKLVNIKPGSENAPDFLKLDPQLSDHFYALVTSKPLPPLCDFTLFNMAGEIQVEIVPWREQGFALTSKQRETLVKFQEVTFTELLKLEESLLHYDIGKPGFALFVGAVLKSTRGFSLDWNFMESVNDRYSSNQMINLADRIRSWTLSSGVSDAGDHLSSKNPDDYEDAVVFPLHVDQNKHPLYVCGFSGETVKSKYLNEDHPDYASYFASKFGIHKLDASVPMLECFYCDKPWLAVPQYLNQMGVVTSARNKYDKRFLLPVEVCEIQATPASMRRLAVCLPMVFFRINNLLLVGHLKDKVAEEVGIGRKAKPGPCQPITHTWTLSDDKLVERAARETAKLYPYGELVDQESDEQTEEEQLGGHVFDIKRYEESSYDQLEKLSLYDDVNWQFLKLPKMNVLLEAITSLNSKDLLNFERLETVGDAFLKFATSAYLFHAHPDANEGQLSSLKTKQISNSNLRKLGIKMKVHEIINYGVFEPMATFLPPGFQVLEGLEEAYSNISPREKCLSLYGSIDKLKRLSGSQIETKLRQDNLPDNKTETGEKRVIVSLRKTQYVSDKSIADCVEALIGAYVTSCGTKCTLFFMAWVGLEVLPKRSDAEREFLFKRQIPPIIAKYTDIPIPETALIKDTDSDQRKIEELLWGFDKLEERIGYSFRDKSYLLQAFTHSSYIGDNVTDCYQRLEFLGDAVIDYVVTCHLYADPMKFNPGELSDLRQALVNNTVFAMLAVKFELHKYIKHTAPSLMKVIRAFADKVQSGKDLLEEIQDMVSENSCAREVEVPKVLGDVVESLIGAIYLDSGYSLNKVWSVVRTLMKKEMEHYRRRIPVNPVRRLLEAYPGERVVFENTECGDDDNAVKVTVDGEFTFCGHGATRKDAKNVVAKIALRKLGLCKTLN